MTIDTSQEGLKEVVTRLKAGLSVHPGITHALIDALEAARADIKKDLADLNGVFDEENADLRARNWRRRRRRCGSMRTRRSTSPTPTVSPSTAGT